MRRITLALPFVWLKSIVWQLIFWTVTYFILITIFAGSSEWQKIDYIYTGIFMATLMLAVAVNAWVILPKFLNRKYYPFFFLLAGMNMAVFAFFNHILFDQLIDHILPGYYFISYYGFADLMKFFVAVVVLATLLHLSLEWFTLQETQHRIALMEKEKFAMELKALYNQVNPHFLFNSLTVLYSLSLKDSKNTSQAIIQLSDILRYVIYGSSGDDVPLQKEADLIRNYISLQRYRIHPSTRIDFLVDVPDDSIRIAPMLLLPCVENSFKHGVEGATENTFVIIRLQSEGGVVTFTIENSRNPEASEQLDGGVGLKNIRERLRLLYHNKHSLNISETENTFQVSMQLITG